MGDLEFSTLLNEEPPPFNCLSKGSNGIVGLIQAACRSPVVMVVSRKMNWLLKFVLFACSFQHWPFVLRLWSICLVDMFWWAHFSWEQKYAKLYLIFWNLGCLWKWTCKTCLFHPFSCFHFEHHSIIWVLNNLALYNCLKPWVCIVLKLLLILNILFPKCQPWKADETWFNLCRHVSFGHTFKQCLFLVL